MSGIYTTNQPSGDTHHDADNAPIIFATEGMPPVLDSVPKCHDCNQPMISIGRPCLNCGERLWQCPECKEVRLAYVRNPKP